MLGDLRNPGIRKGICKLKNRRVVNNKNRLLEESTIRKSCRRTLNKNIYRFDKEKTEAGRSVEDTNCFKSFTLESVGLISFTFNGINFDNRNDRTLLHELKNHKCLTITHQNQRRSKVSDTINAEEILMSGRTFKEKMIDVIPFVDPDSTRFIEWVWSIRYAAGLSTYSEEFEIPNTVSADVRELKELVKGKFKVVYDSTYYFRGIRENEETGIPEFVAIVGRCNGVPLVVCSGEEDEVKEVIGLYKEKYKAPDSIEVNVLTGFSEHGPNIVKKTVLENKIELATDAFYPFLNETLDSFVDRYKKSSAPVLLLWGDPGTGKSTFLRTLLFKLKIPNIHTSSNESIISHTGLNSWLEDTGPSPVICIEDADNLVMKRESGNPQMSMLLNFTQGIVSNDVRMIISTNLHSIDKVDEALLRVGRSFQIVQFKRLSIPEALAARKSIGLEEIEFDSSLHEVTLSEALNYNGLAALDNHKHSGFGFISNGKK